MMLKTKKEIISWLEFYRIQDYSINDDMSIDVNRNVEFFSHHIKLESLPVQFNIVRGSFKCNGHKLTSLKGSPHTVAGDFFCHLNKLTSLEYSPKTIGGNFSCANNKITMLNHSPVSVGGDFICNSNGLISFENFNTKFKGTLFFDRILSAPQELLDMYTSQYMLRVTHKQLHSILLNDRLKNSLVDKKEIQHKFKI